MGSGVVLVFSQCLSVCAVEKLRELHQQTLEEEGIAGYTEVRWPLTLL